MPKVKINLAGDGDVVGSVLEYGGGLKAELYQELMELHGRATSYIIGGFHYITRM